MKNIEVFRKFASLNVKALTPAVGAFTFERERVHRNGEILYVMASYQPLIINNKKYVLGIYKDISELKKAALVKREIEERYKSLFYNNPDIVWLTDKKGNIISINPAIQELLEYTVEEWISSPLKLVDRWGEEQFKEHMYYVNKSLLGETHEYEMFFFHKQGEKVDFKIKTFPIIVDDEIVGVFGISRDITQQKKRRRNHLENWRLLTA